MKKIILLCSCLAFTLLTQGQTEDKKWNIGLHGGVTQYQGDLGNNFYKTDKAYYGFGGISVSRYLGRYFDLNFLASKGTIGYNDGTARSFNTDFNAVALNLRFNMTGSESILRPYVFAGVGAILFDKDLSFDKDLIDYALPTVGGGINIRLTDVITLNLQETFSFSNKDRRDGIDDNGKKDAYLSHMAGLTFNLGDKKDADNDGVGDRKDICANTPAGVSVDENGCPLDKDKDGVADYLDKCPDVAGLASLNGCPDLDKDGVTDSADKCPDTKSGTKVDATGCPMDTDNDGVENGIDNCPDVAGSASLNGCPDEDGDGVADNDDRCPTEKGTIENKGCPEIAKKDIERITYLGSKIFFENNSAKLKVGSLVQLDELLAIINKYDASNLTIEGHADSNGSDALNLELSQKRTESVKEYLTQKGIAETRITAIGFGETKPIATNSTVLGRAKNRRVELKMSY
ncbi:Thrombospondin type 3 repeat-containing protein [Flavobacterium micromati]|uniref:Thrombospondin type 3 repeat-containing protein n=1 Tax=Flavobacterium micromati TaxID=229205 RepID=A0A1M5I1L3_9FLAO|nr:OmpA family protein [Flavobacterium micromati]SHG21913.1 Thrombospondin type 3 repeat-containing protein [Flavobacterium micromati]